MKTTLLTLITVMAFACSANAYYSLRVQDPQQWSSYDGNIDSAVLSIKPKGAYMECGLYLTFSEDIQYYSANSMYEIQMYFELPEGALVTDSWLWVGNQIVRADIRDRGKANLIYEGIVNRRKDPSILYKNSATQYELRVFPMLPGQTRKVKITYLLPVKWGQSTTSIPLPVDLLKTSARIPAFQILSYTDAAWHSPGIEGYAGINFQQVNSAFGYTHRANIAPGTLLGASEMEYKLSSPLQNGVYAAKYETSPADGYYQLVVVPSKMLDITPRRKAALLFDNEPMLSTTTAIEAIYKAKAMLHNNYTERDSFNLLFASQSIYKVSNTWLPCDSATIETTFNNLTINAVSGISNLPMLLNEGIDFLKNNGADGEIVLITNSDNYTTAAAANQLINTVKTHMLPYTFRINTVNYANQNTINLWFGNRYYYGNEYFGSNIAALTGGNYEQAAYNNYYYYSYQFKPFSEVMTKLFESLEGRISNFDVQTDVQNGFCYARYDMGAGASPGLSKPYVQFGKYQGTLPLEVEISGSLNANVFSKNISISDFYDADTTTRQMWIGQYIRQLELIPNPDNQTRLELMDSSINNRVLSTLTAFLALEPSDTVTICATCVDETGNPTVPTALNDLPTDSLMLTALPNPFMANVSISIRLAENTRNPTLKIYNLMGQMVKQFSIDGNQSNITLEWNGADETGTTVNAGVYILTLETENMRQTLKLVKQ